MLGFAVTFLVLAGLLARMVFLLVRTLANECDRIDAIRIEQQANMSEIMDTDFNGGSRSMNRARMVIDKIERYEKERGR